MGVASLLSGLFSSSQTASSSANGISTGSDILTTNFNGYKSTLDSLVAFANPSSGVGQFFVPTGMIAPFAGPSLVTPPAGWLFCNGAEVPQAGTYADLYALIQGTYNTGSEAVGNFRLPDLRGRTLIGVGTATSGASLTGVLGVVQGASGTVLTNANIPQHSHDLQNHTHNYDHAHDATLTGSMSGSASVAIQGLLARKNGTGGDYNTYVSASPQSTLSGSASVSGSVGGTTGTVSAKYGSANTGAPSTNNSGNYGSASPTAVSAVQPSFPLNYIIKY